MRLVIPVNDESGLKAQICSHFGRTPYFAVIDLDKKGNIATQSTISSSGEHFCEGINFISNLKPDFMIAHGMGQRVIYNLQNAGIRILRTSANVVNDAIQQYNKGELVELTDGCQH